MDNELKDFYYSKKQEEIYRQQNQMRGLFGEIKRRHLFINGKPYTEYKTHGSKLTSKLDDFTFVCTDKPQNITFGEVI